MVVEHAVRIRSGKRVEEPLSPDWRQDLPLSRIVSGPGTDGRVTTTYNERSTVIDTVIELNEDVLLAAKKGAFWLDEVCAPGWEQRINLDTLRMWDGACCIIGQVEPEDRPWSYHCHRGTAWLVEHGFTTTDNDVWPNLTYAWTSLIHERLDEGSTARN